MRDALGSTVVLSIIVIFVVVALGYAAFNVNYMKAFRMKNKVISTYEDYDGSCNSDCQEEITKYAKEIGYTMGNMQCPPANENGSWKRDANSSYCYQDIISMNSNNKNISSIKSIKSPGSNGTGQISDIKYKHYYKIVTKINIEIPVISRIFDFKLFQITGDTRAFEKDN